MQVPEFPAKLFFFCEVEPGSGGETPIVLSHIVYDRMKTKHPEFVQRLEEQGLLYTRVLGEEDDPSSPIGRGWKSTFLTDDKITAEKRFLIRSKNVMSKSSNFFWFFFCLNSLSEQGCPAGCQAGMDGGRTEDGNGSDPGGQVR